MSAISPSTDLYLLKSPLELDMDNQLTFSSASAQANYFRSLPHKLVQEISYQRKDGVIRFPEHIDNLLDYNYVMYKNSNYGNKWFYAFITHMEYANDNMTLISIETDPYQTFMFELEFKKSFVEREHVNDDTFGLHTVDENLTYGDDYICNGRSDCKYGDKDAENSLMICAQVTAVELEVDYLTDITQNPQSVKYSLHFPDDCEPIYNGIPQGCYVIAVPYSEESLGQLRALVGLYDSAGRGDAITSLFLVPRVCCQWEDTYFEVEGQETTFGEFKIPKASFNAHSYIANQVSMNTTIDGYTPVNNKVKCYPYNYLYLTNNAGGDVTYKWENFNGDPTFVMDAAFDQGGSVVISPQNSKITAALPAVTGDGWNESLAGAKLPILSWTSDYYLNWQAVHGTDIQIQAGLAAANWGASMLSSMAGASIGNTASTTKRGKLKGGQSTSDVAGDVGGMIGSTLSLADQVRSLAQQDKEARMIPPQAKGNIASASIGFSLGESKFTFKKMSIKSEYAKLIDDYFSAFGYRVISFKVPNITGRLNWNYVKTAGINIEGDIPQEYMQQIKAMFNKGVTLWHNPTTFLDYSKSNAIVS